MGKVRSWLAAGLMAAASVQAWAQGGPCGPYRVALYEYGALTFRNAERAMVGIDADILSEVSRRTGCRFDTFVDSRVRTWTDLAQGTQGTPGTLDMTVSAIDTEDRSQYLRFILYMSGRNRLLVRSDLAGAVTNLNEFAERSRLRLAVVKGFRHGPKWDQWIDQLRQQGRVDEYSDAGVAARLVAAGRNAAFMSEPVVWKRVLADSKLAGRVAVIDAFPDDNYAAGFALSRARVREEEADKIQGAITAMRADGSLLRIFSAYLPRGEALASMP